MTDVWDRDASTLICPEENCWQTFGTCGHYRAPIAFDDRTTTDPEGERDAEASVPTAGLS
jgi:hypothetical protein